MNGRLKITANTAGNYFYLEPFTPEKTIVSFLIGAAEGKALSCNDDYCAARFLTTQ
jgi:hypothetical protein